MINRLIDKYKRISLVAKATIWFTITNILQKGLLFLSTPIYTRLMSPSEYGRYSIILSWLEIFEIIATFRIGWGGYVVGLTKFKDDRDRYTSSMQMLSIIITSAFLFIYVISRDVVNTMTNLDTRTTLVIFGIIYALPAIQFWLVRGRVEYKYIKVFILATLSSVIVISAGTIAAVISGTKDFAVVFARFVVQGSFAIYLIWANCHKRFTVYHKDYWKRALSFNVPLLPYYLSMVILHSSDRIIIGNLCGTSFAAIYSAAYTLSSCMQIFNQSFTQTIQPLMYKSMREENVEKIPSIISASLSIIIGLNCLLVLVAPELIRIVAPSEYADAIWIIPPLCASVVVMYIYQQFVNVEFYFEESRLIAIASIGAACLNVYLNYMFIPIYGYFAAGYTTLASYMIFAACHYCFMKIVVKKNNYSEKLVPVKNMILLLVIYTAVTAVAAIGYEFCIIRVALVLAILIVGFCFRSGVIGMFSELVHIKK
ncbi:Membrane protein involved in the export of O-antigen and teichoic acid [Butyrivibrio proteoclasticus]|uniref:Membrane protein involved in the export of O-antigen and teichoic acid n=1 Tax=Butyrivibrio proteoclasticus TaxID=43305 RepID=A0A1I5TBA2_9FIRM|nr:oligosaccharide flippase family protein [Butyrivibrio proteoclasticus]SFP80325.1 Membrane protein involved in the export of O-antigen and teichoic acid [Butyrivibrio proteoclasticus]